MADPVSNNFSAEGIQYSKNTSYYLAAGPASSGLGDAAGVTSLNGSIGQVIIAGANGVNVSTGPAPTVSLGDITPLSVNTPGAIGAAAISAYSATFTGAVNASGGTLSANSINATGNITTGLAVNCGTVTATGALTAASMAVSGALTTGTFNVSGALQIASFTNGSLGATTPYAMVWGSGNQATLVIAGWRLSWGLSTGADTNGNIGVTFNTAFTGIPAISILSCRAGGGDSFMANGLSPPTATGFNLSCINRGSGNAFGATCSWIAIGQA